MAKPDFTQLKPALDSARLIALLLPRNPSYDAVASALALKLSLEQSGKNVSLACPSPMTVEYNRLVGVDSITNSFGSRNFVISFPDQTDIVDRVSYNIEAGQLQLVITPKPGTAGIDYRQLKFTSAGIQADMVILVGVDRLSDLDHIYTDIKDFLPTTKTVSLNQHFPLENFSTIQISDSSSSSICEITTQLIESLGTYLNVDVASNLLAGLETATNHFQVPNLTAATFEFAALLLRHGAKRHDVYSAPLPQGSIPQSSNNLGYGTDSQPAAPNPDWFEPKVFRGTNLG